MPERDRQIIRRMEDGENLAFEEFALAWYPRIVGWVSVRTTPDKVTDYAHEVWIHLTKDGCRNLLKWHGLEADGDINPNSLASFLKTVTIRRVISMHRIDNRDWLGFGEDGNLIDDDGQLGVDPPDTVEGEQVKIQFRHCFGLLPRLDKRMLIMRWNSRSDEEIGRFFQKSAVNVRQRRFQMVKRLKECLSDRLPGYFTSE